MDVPSRGPGAGLQGKPVAAAILLAYVIAAAAALLHAGGALHAPDEKEYLAIGANLARHGWFSMDGATSTAWRTPGLPAIIAVLLSIWPSVYLIKLVTLGCWAATGLLVGRLAARFHGPAAGHLAALLFLVYAYELYAATTLYPQTIAGLLVVVAVTIAVRPPPLTLAWQILLAAVCGYQILLVPNCIVVPAAVYSYALLQRRIRLRAAVAAGAVILLVIFGWCYRNEQAVGGFSFTTTMGNTMYEGNRENVTAATAGPTDLPDLEAQTRNLPEIARDKFYRNLAKGWIASHPWQAARLSVAKFVYWFAPGNTYQTQGSVPGLGLLSLAMAVIYYPILAGSLAAIASGNRAVRGFAILSWVIYLAAAGTYCLFVTRIRYRLPFDPLLFAIAPGMLLQLVPRRWRPRTAI